MSEDGVEIDFLKLAETFFQEVEENIGKYKNLKSADIPGIPDEELEDAVMEWIWGKLDTDWSKQQETLTKMSDPCKTIYACRTIRDEVSNGGFMQVFFNELGRIVELAQNGFMQLGLEELGEIMKEAMDTYKKNREILEGEEEENNDEIFDSLEEQFYNLCEESDLEKRMVIYIREHVKYFGE